MSDKYTVPPGILWANVEAAVAILAPMVDNGARAAVEEILTLRNDRQKAAPIIGAILDMAEEWGGDDIGYASSYDVLRQWLADGEA